MYIVQHHRSNIVFRYQRPTHSKSLEICHICLETPQKGRHQSCQRSEGGRSRPSSWTVTSSHSSCSSGLSPSMGGGLRDRGKGGEGPWEKFDRWWFWSVVTIFWWTNLDTPIRASRMTKITIKDKMPLFSILWKSFDIFLLFHGKLTVEHFGQHICGCLVRLGFWKSES